MDFACVESMDDCEIVNIEELVSLQVATPNP
jgi:hypothetical protein